MARVSIHDVNKIFHGHGGEVHAVHDLNLTVEDGEFVSIVGPSGCGKSTTLRMIVGLETPTSGEIRFDDAVVNGLEPQQRNVAMAFETYALYPNFTVGENIGFPLEVRKVPKPKRERRVRELATLLQIEPILERQPHTLSGGQKQRVSLARALIREPAAFILDEVLGHVDGHLRFQMLFDLKRLHQSLDSTMIFVTHDQMEALALSDRIAVMHQGRLKQCGTRDELYHRPVDRFVADFIGEPPTNFFDARPVPLGNNTALAVEGTALVFRLSPERESLIRTRNEDRYTLGIRPQNLFRDAREGMDKVSATVDLNEYLGERSILTLQNEGQPLQALSTPEDRAKKGDRIDLFYRPEDVMVFDAKTDKLIA